MGVNALLDRKVGFIGGSTARRLSRMGLEQDAPIVEADGLAVRTRTQASADQATGQGIQRLGDLGVLITGDLGLRPEGYVVGRGRRGEQCRSLDRLVMLARHPLSATVTTHAVFLEAPAPGMTTCLLDRRQGLARKAVVAYMTHAALATRLVARSPHASRIDHEASRLAVLAKRLDDARLQGVGGLDDRLGAVRDQHMENAAVELPGRLAGFDRRCRGFALDRIDETVARNRRSEDESLQAPAPTACVRLEPAHPARVDLDFLARLAIDHGQRRRLASKIKLLTGKAVQCAVRNLDSPTPQQLADLCQTDAPPGQ
jgi:hypothetical protein